MTKLMIDEATKADLKGRDERIILEAIPPNKGIEFRQWFQQRQLELELRETSVLRAWSGRLTQYLGQFDVVVHIDGKPSHFSRQKYFIPK